MWDRIRNWKHKKAITVAALVVIAGVSVTACSGLGGAAGSSINNDQQSSDNSLHQLQQNQPTPQFNYSQERQTLISVEEAQADTTQTTSFFFNMGVQDPIGSCPSIGVPVASTTELTNPWQDDDQGANGNAGVAIGEADPTGVYAGDSTGTYVLCVNADGTNYLQYWEGYVDTVTGPAVWNTTTHSVQLTGPSSVAVKTHK